MMNSLIQWIDPDLVQALGWTLLHSLWQGGAIALLLAVGLIIMRKSSAAARYWVSMSSLLILLTTTIFTFSMLYEPGEGSAMIAPVNLTNNWQQELPEAGLDLDAQPVLSAANHPTVYADYFEQHLPLLVTAWLLGVLLLCLRMLGEIAYIQHLKNYRCKEVGPRWLNRLQSMCAELNIRRKVQLRETFRVHAPMVVGVFKPVILFPIGLLANLPAEQVESILAHELAHIRRHDYLINLFQALVEILLFFNPAMWWISGKIKAEREHSCDDLAINMTGDTIAFVKSLARLEEWRLQGQSMAMSFTGQRNGLLGRIQRLANREDKRKIPAKAFWSLSVVGFCMALLVFQTTPAESQTGVENVPVEEPVTVETSEPEVEAGVIVTEAEPLNEEVEPEEVVQTGTIGSEVFILNGNVFAVAADSVPEDLAKMEAEMTRIEKEMSAQMRDMQAKMRVVQNEQLQKQKELQVKMQAQQRKMMELSMNMQKMENDQQMLEQQYDIGENDLEMEELQLDQLRDELHVKREQLESEAKELSGEDLKNRLKAVQESQRALLEKEKALQMRKHANEKQFKEDMMQREKAMQELEASQIQMEREIELMERDFEMEMLKFEQQQENMSVDQELLEREWEARQEALEKRAEEVEREMESKRKQE